MDPITVYDIGTDPEFAEAFLVAVAAEVGPEPEVPEGDEPDEGEGDKDD